MLTIQKLPLCSKGAPVAITLENSNHMRVTLLSYGATIQSIVVPDRNGVLTDVLLGYETVKEYEENDGYLGACIGRNGNRIAGAAFTLNGQRFHLTANEGKNQLHGGLCGFDKKLWNYNCRENSVEFTTVLADGEEGYPGRLDVSITFTLTDDNALRIDYRAVSQRGYRRELHQPCLFQSQRTGERRRAGPSAPAERLRLYARRCRNAADRRDRPRGRHLHGLPHRRSPLAKTFTTRRLPPSAATIRTSASMARAFVKSDRPRAIRPAS